MVALNSKYRRVVFRIAIHLTLTTLLLFNYLIPKALCSQINLPFRDIGPVQTGGRVTAVLGIPGDYNTYYLGAAGGGLWKTTDGGQKWTGIFTHGPSSSIGAIAVDPHDADVIWVGTGETTLRNGSIDGHGLFRSPDGGKTWQLMGFAHSGQIGSILINPKNSNDILLGVMGHQWGANEDRGIFRSEDGGKTWQKVLYVNSFTGCPKIERDPKNPQILFAAMWEAHRRPWQLIDGGVGSGIYRTNDDGKHWQKLTQGLPPGPLGKVTVALAPSNPSRVYALIEAKDGRLWRSDNAGNSWTLVSNDHSLAARPFYFTHMEVSPDNENVLYFASLNLLESDDGGKTVHRIDPGVHSDYHALWVDPATGKHIYTGNDGGAYETNDGGIGWQKFGNIPLGQFYAAAAATIPGMPPGAPFLICGGLQDNNGWCGKSSDLDRTDVSGIDWHSVVGGDGDYLVPAPSDPNIIYVTAATVSTGAVYRLDVRTGISRFIRPYWPIAHEMGTDKLKYRFNLSTPVAVSRSDSNVAYVGTSVVFKTTDGGVHWDAISPDLTQNDKSKQQIGGGPIEPEISGSENYDTILSVSIAPTDPNVLWVGTDDGLVWVTRDDGKHWSNVRPHLQGTPDWSRVYQVGVSPFDPGTAYIAMNADRMDDTHIYVYRTHDFGKTWTSITTGLPEDAPGHVVREDPNKKGLLMVGTDRGVYYSLNDGDNWYPANKDFPTTPVWDLHFVKTAHAAVLATHGRGIFVFDNLRPIEEMDPTGSNGLYVFTPSPGILYHLQRWGEPTIPYYSVPNVAPGVDITYVLSGQASSGSVKAVIKDAQGTAIAHLGGPAKEGLNSLVWNMRYDGPTPLFAEQPPGRRPSEFRRFFAPMVVPGHYTVDVSYNGQVMERGIDVVPDPRFSVSQYDYRKHVEVALDLRDEMNSMDEMLNQLAELEQQLSQREKDLPKNASSGQLGQQIQSLTSKVTALEDKFLTPGIQLSAGEDNLHALMRLYLQIQRTAMTMFTTYIYLPDPSMEEAVKEQRSDLLASLSDYNRLVQAEVSNLNTGLSAAGLSPIKGITIVKIPQTRGSL